MESRTTPSPAIASTTAWSALAPWLAFASCTLIWSSTFVAISIGNDALPPMWGVSLRLALAAIILAAIARATGDGLPRGAAARAAAGYGVCQFGVGFPLLYWGEQAVPSGLAAVVYATVPLWSALFARAFGLERIRPPQLAAAGLGLAGIAAMFSAQIRASVPALPFLAVLAAATSASLGNVLLKRGPRQSAFGVNALGALLALPLCLAASFASGEAHPLPRTAGAIIPVLYLTLASSVVAYVLMAWLIHRWPVTRISFMAVLIPVLAVLLGRLVRGERLTAANLAGAAVVLVGVSLGVGSDWARASATSRERAPR